ncbi:MAG: Holliday junction branch migration protein RuvA, partial [Lachnospiraceae bacterium]|nr:Holliday junction branch migration protein RuvA [Lachnospiraceae bacterium]
MIAFLHGELYGVTETSAIVECAGVGYEAVMPASDLENLPDAGEQVRIFTYLNVNENTGVNLFGFLTQESLAMFKLLITVSGVGPKVAVGILSVLPPTELARAIFADDAKAISKAPGVGGKLASKIILELKDKVLVAESAKLP